MAAPKEVTVRQARTAEDVAVRRVLDGAMLATEAVAGSLERDDVLVAVAGEHVVGALVLVPVSSIDLPGEIDTSEGMHVDAVAVTRRRRDGGIGRALVEAALDREGRLTVTFDGDVVAFYEALGFEIVEGESRCWGFRDCTETSRDD